MAAPKGNKFAAGYGRPVKFKSAEELESRIEDYFASRNKTRIVTTKIGSQYEEEYMLPKTLSGLALALDCDRSTLLNYKKEESFFATIARARAECENFSEEQLYGPYAHGAKFGLINNYHQWAEKTETEIDLRASHIVKITDLTDE